MNEKRRLSKNEKIKTERKKEKGKLREKERKREALK